MNYLTKQLKEHLDHVEEEDIDKIVNLLISWGDLYPIRNVYYEIYLEYLEGEPIKNIAKKYGYSYTHTTKIIKPFRELQ